MLKIENTILNNIWKDRYKKGDETLQDNISRVINYVAENDHQKDRFADVMLDGLFLPAGRTMSNAGIGRDLTLNNCFVAPSIQDDLKDIFDKVSLGALTHQRGGKM